jgi:hypothetical protein
VAETWPEALPAKVMFSLVNMATEADAPLEPLVPAAPSATLYTLVASPIPASDVTALMVTTSFTHTA